MAQWFQVRILMSINWFDNVNKVEAGYDSTFTVYNIKVG